MIYMTQHQGHGWLKVKKFTNMFTAVGDLAVLQTALSPVNLDVEGQNFNIYYLTLYVHLLIYWYLYFMNDFVYH
jgi:hypothetical protein